MKRLLMAVIFFTFTLGVFAQSADLYEKSESLNSYPYSDPDPVAAPGRIYPYFRFDGYTATGSKMNWNMVEMENPYIKIYVTPQIGGKVWGAMEKSTGKEFLYFNHAVKFRDVAMRGPWTSGGVEFNFGLIGHAPSCSSPVDYITRKNADSSVSCFVGSTDLPSGTHWMVEINVPKDKAYFTTRSFWYNPSGLEQSYYHWTNAGIKVAGNLEYAYPGRYYLGHDGSNHPWPVDAEGRKLSMYENNNFEGYKSYHVFGEYTGFYGGYWHNDEFGTGHYADYDEKPGKKLWIWGLSRQGMIWEDLLTDTDGQYTEIQSGRLFNQEAPNSTYTPFKHRAFVPGGTDTWTEYWFPVKGTEGLKYGTPEGAVNLETRDNKIIVWYCPLIKTNAKLKILQEDKIIFEKQISLAPMQLFKDSIPFTGKSDKLKVVLGDNMVLYNSDHEALKLNRPVEMPVGFEWSSVYGLYLQGNELDKQRLWEDARRNYESCLQKDPNYLPALTAMANLCIRADENEKALTYATKALAIDTYDPAANFAYGMANSKLNNYADAADGYSIASASVEYRASSYVELAKLFLSQHQPEQARKYAMKAVETNPMEVPAFELLATLARLRGDQKAALSALDQLEAIDPLNHKIQFEKYLLTLGKSTANDFTSLIRTELSQEVYLELAAWYHNLGLDQDVAGLLSLAPDQPEINYWRAWLAHKVGDTMQSSEFLKKANEGDPSLVFPYLAESKTPLQWAINNSASWKPKYYLGLIYWNSGNKTKAKELFGSCGDEPDFYPFYLSRVKLVESKDTTATRKDLQRAVLLAPEAWRAELQLSRFYESLKQYAKAKEISAKAFAKLPQNYYLGLNLAKELFLNNEPEACVSLLAKLNVLPNEGATAGYKLWRESNLVAAMNAYAAKKYKKSLVYLAQSRSWPENLGVGRPYDVDERLPDYIESLCYKAMKNNEKAAGLEKSILAYSQSKEFKAVGAVNLISACLLRNNQQESVAGELIGSLPISGLTERSTRWVKAKYSHNKSLADLIEKEEPIVPKEDPNEVAIPDADFNLMIRLSKLTDF